MGAEDFKNDNMDDFIFMEYLTLFDCLSRMVRKLYDIIKRSFTLMFFLLSAVIKRESLKVEGSYISS